MQLTVHFHLDEFTVSETAARKGIDNTPPPAIVEKLKYTARCMEAVRLLLGVPIIITSGFRSPELNAEIGGSQHSQHCRGEAVDFVAPRFGRPYHVCRAIEASEIAFDQLIYEGGWTHISFVEPRKPRREALTWLGGGRYEPGIGSRS